ncbi:MAG: hypothetical protein JW847_03330 [Candidatus Omnitrophica bacterium]|nr:hypothetical protein [Candidatus Omnitrophota bacterium]
MTILIYMGIAALLFIIGIIFILKSIPSEDEKVVPILDFKEIRKMNDENALSQTGGTKDAMGPRMANEGQPYENRILEENHQLRKEIVESKVKYEQLEERMEGLRKEYGQLKEREEKNQKIFMNENVRMKAEREELSSSEGILSELKNKIELLEKQYRESQMRQGEMEAMIGQLRAEKNDLLAQTRMKEEQAEAQRKEQAFVSNKSEFEALSNKLVESISTIEELKRENKDLQREKQELMDKFKKTEELNNHLMKKEKMMQYELTKNRAQAIGLEKICADFRTKIETLEETAAEA